MTILRDEMNTMIWEGSAMPVYRADAKRLKNKMAAEMCTQKIQMQGLRSE